MRTTAATILLVLSAAALSACSASPAPAPTPAAPAAPAAPTAVAAPAAASAGTSDSVFLGLVSRSVSIPLDSTTAVSNAHVICTGLSHGVGPMAFGDDLVRKNTGLTYTEAGAFIADAVGVYCPENQPVLDAFQAAHHG
jgi:hypothetical protein